MAAADGARGAQLHSITSSARPTSAGGISMPSALAVLRLKTSSNLVGCSTGISQAKILSRILPNRLWCRCGLASATPAANRPDGQRDNQRAADHRQYPVMLADAGMMR